MWSHKKFIGMYLLFTGLIALPFLANFVFISKAFENSDFGEIAAFQQERDAIYGTALNQNTFLYKLKLVEQRRPKIIALGSSRVMQFREEFFNESFVNCGGAMNHLNEGRMFLERMVRVQRPEVLILGLDFWWFNDNFSQPSSYAYHENSGRVMTWEKIIGPFRLMKEKKISVRTYRDILLGRRHNNGIAGHENMGLRAISHSDGFRKDGSYLYARTVFGFDPKYEDINFGNTLSRIRKGTDRFEYGNELSAERIREFEEILEICRKNNIKVVIILPPIAEAVSIAMDEMKERYSYIPKFREYAMSLPYEVYDFTNIRDAGSDDCECIDGFHGGDVTYQKMLLKIIKQRPDSILKDHLNISSMASAVSKFRGKTLSTHDDARFMHKETDFLKLGCRK